MAHGDVHVVIKAGPFGEGSAGHSHSDMLSLVARIGDRDILIDPGTYTYIADPVERNGFRGSAAHNTVRIDGRDQAIPAGPFRWIDKPDVRIDTWSTTPNRTCWKQPAATEASPTAARSSSSNRTPYFASWTRSTPPNGRSTGT